MPLTEKMDYKKLWKDQYGPSSKVVSFLEVPEHDYLMIDGKGDPNHSKDFAAATEALFSVSYALKFQVKRGPQKIDYGVMPLEGLWWADDMSVFTTGDKSAWSWTLMILQPPQVSREMALDAITESVKKGATAASRLRFESYREGLCAQIMHIGPFSEEGPTVEHLHHAIEAAGHKLRSKHHEIYLSDIRRADPANWKTVIRQGIL